MAKVDVVMPKMGESVMEGTVLTWHKQPGDAIEADETLLEIGTDKVDSEIPSPASGTLSEIKVPEGETVEVGTVLAVIQTEAEAAPADSNGTPSPAEETAEDETSPDSEQQPAESEASKREAEPESEAETETEPEAETESKAEAEPGTTKSAPAPSGAGQDGTGESSRSSSSSVVEVVMPKMGESVMEGTVLTWHKKEGDRIEADEALLEIGTDKVDSDIPSPESGVVQEIKVAEGETVEVGTVLATIATERVAPKESPEGESGEPASTAKASGPAKSDEEPAGKREESGVSTGEAAPAGGDGLAAETARRGGDGRFYSPLVRSIAETEGVSAGELESIPGSGREGRVTKDDILSYLDKRQSGGEAAPAETSETPSIEAPSPKVEPAAPASKGRVETIEMDRMRQVIAEHMTRSLATSAHVTSFAEADVTNLVRLRQEKKESFEEREGVRLTYTPFFVKAAVDALREHPVLNASVEENRIIIKKDFHIGIAVAIEKTGLVVPVIRNAGGMNLTGLAHAASDLAQRARSKQLQPDELQGGTFTVTNVGSLGSLMGTPIINQPQVAILAMGAITKRPVVKEHPDLGDVIAVRHMVYLSLSYDHRIIDGAMAASFLRHLVRNLEEIGEEYPL